MDIRDSVYGEIAVRSGTHVTGIQLGTLVQRLLLFDRVVIRSCRLREMPFLLRAFGRNSLVRLIDTGILQISCQFTSTISSMVHNGVRTLPPFHFNLGTADIQDPEKVLKSELRCLQGVPGLKNADRATLEETILSKLARPRADYGGRVLSQIEFDLRGNMPAFRAAIDHQLQKRFGLNRPHAHVHVEETQHRVFHVVNDLATTFRIDPAEAHELIESAVQGVSAANHRLADMEEYFSITGFADDEAPILFGKLSGILGSLNPKPLEENFHRVITLAGIPDFGAFSKVNVDNLLQAREAPERREFRNWLSKSENLSDAEVAEIVADFRKRIGVFLQTKSGKALRFVVTAATGMIPGPGTVAGLGLGVVDTFLLERLFPKAGYLAFLTQTYPSLFEK